ncbi:MAG TPA: FkbM family methyltransferase [Pirellulales bacterium]|nr:FkbM family methyltransferase [Pirellulales bacterium]
MPGGIQAVAGRRPHSLASFRMMRGLQREKVAPRTIIDLGANVGQFARAANSAFPEATIYSVEPNPDVVALLRSNLADISQLKVIATAIGDIDGEIEFHCSPQTQTSSVLRHASKNGHENCANGDTRTIVVPIQRLDSLFAEVTLPSPVLLKLDLQGYELAALKGGKELLQQVEYVVVEAVFEEFYVGEPHFEAIWEYLRAAGFTMLRPMAFLCDRQGAISQTDVLFRRMPARADHN